MSARLSLEDQRQIEALLTEYNWRIDAGRGVECAELFSQGGTLEFMGQKLAGRAAIGAAFARELEARTYEVRHLWSNVHLLRCDGAVVEIQTLAMTVLAARNNLTKKRIMLGDTHDVLEQTSGEWRFRSRQLTEVMPFEEQ